MNVTLAFRLLCALCGLLLLADLIYHRHGYFSWESWFGFFAFCGFLGSIVLALAARWLRSWLAREEDFHDR